MKERALNRHQKAASSKGGRGSAPLLRRGRSPALAAPTELALITNDAAADDAADDDAVRPGSGIGDAATLARISRYLTSDLLQCVQLLSGSLDLGTPGEYTLGSLRKLMAHLSGRCRVDERSMFVDIGSGLGRPCFAAVLTGTFRQAVGVEIVRQQVEAARAAASRFGVSGRVAFLHGDATQVALPREGTHMYMFGQGFEGGLLEAVAAQLNRASRWTHLVSATKPAKWAEAGLRFNEGSETTLAGMAMVGSGRKYAVHIITRGNV